MAVITEGSVPETMGMGAAPRDEVPQVKRDQTAFKTGKHAHKAPEDREAFPRQ